MHIMCLTLSALEIQSDKMAKRSQDNTMLSSTYPIHGSVSKVNARCKSSPFTVIMPSFILLLSSLPSSISPDLFSSLLLSSILPVLELHHSGIHDERRVSKGTYTICKLNFNCKPVTDTHTYKHLRLRPH